MDKLMEMLKTMADDHNKMMAKIEANRRADREEMTVNNKTMLTKMDMDKEQVLAEMKANQETTARMDAKMGAVQVELKSASKT
jgi:hypothetical protein